MPAPHVTSVTQQVAGSIHDFADALTAITGRCCGHGASVSSTTPRLGRGQFVLACNLFRSASSLIMPTAPTRQGILIVAPARVSPAESSDVLTVVVPMKVGLA